MLPNENNQTTPTNYPIKTYLVVFVVIFLIVAGILLLFGNELIEIFTRFANAS